MRTHMSRDVELFLYQYWEDIGTPLASRLQWYLSIGQYEKLAELLDRDFTTIKDPIRLLKARMCVDIIRKADYLPTDNDCVYACLGKWAKAEVWCRQTNLQVKRVLCNHAKQDKILAVWLPKIKATMKRLLGPLPDLADVFGGFGPGATLSNTRSQSSALYKLQTDTPSLTEGALWFLPALPPRVKNLWFGEGKAPEIVEAGRLQLVPKTYKTDRPIMVEPLVNASIQRFFGKAIERRLRFLGIDKSLAPQRHCELAKIGSITGQWATIDLSSASDTISYELVKAILPEDWFRCLDQCRTPRIDLGEWRYGQYAELLERDGIYDDVYTLEKFSSMGNGFTFELETMIFFAICVAVCGRDATAGVYGDDIIVKDNVADKLCTVLRSCGFVINSDKTFSGVPYFRESCGGDYLHGTSVKGVTLKTEPESPMDWMELHNRLWLLQDEHKCLNLTRTLIYCENRVPKHLRLGIPARLGTGGFFRENQYLKPKIKDGICYFKCLVVKAKYLKDWESLFEPDVILAAILMDGVGTQDTGITDGNVKLLRKNGWPLGPLAPHRDPSYRIAWVPCS